MAITIRKIAKDLQLAVSTVSKALNDSHEISAATRKRVLEYAAKLDYLPNPYASSLKRRKTGNIAVVLPEVADSFFSIAVNGIEAVAQEKGYHVIIYLTHEDAAKERAILHDFRSGRVDGVLMSVSHNTNNDDHIHELLSRNIPLVFFDRVCSAVETAKVTTDDLEAGYQATEHLISKGCREILFLAVAGNNNIIQQRQEGYQRALAHHGLSIKKNNILLCTQEETENHTLIKQALTRSKRPDGIIGSVEKLGISAYTVCHELELHIPRDVKVIAFSNLEIAALLNPSLSTMTQPAFEMGKAAASLLFKALQKKKPLPPGSDIVIPSVLHIRQSTT